NLWVTPGRSATHFPPRGSEVLFATAQGDLRQGFVNHFLRGKEMHPAPPFGKDEFAKRTIQAGGKTGCNSRLSSIASSDTSLSFTARLVLSGRTARSWR